MSVKYSKTCLCCGHIDIAYNHHFSVLILECLKRLQALDEIYPWQNFSFAQIMPTKSQYTNFWKLRYWGLAELNEETGWRITQKGRDFLVGNIKIPNYVVIFKDQLMPPDHEGWIGCEQLPRPIGIDEVTDRVKRDREYYREQKREAIHA